MDKIKILVIDDGVDFLKVMGAHITKWGYDLLKALNGKEGINIFAEKKLGKKA